MFNKPIPSDIKFETSLFLLPELETASFQDVGEVGAGFGPTRITPIHAALLSAVAMNGGVMMAPYLVEEAYDKTGALVYKAMPQSLGRVFKQATADKLKVLMMNTVRFGSRHSISARQKRLYIKSNIIGKTGTLNDPENRALLYTWFSGGGYFNETSLESISIGTLIVSPSEFVTRAVAIAQKTLFEHLKHSTPR